MSEVDQALEAFVGVVATFRCESDQVELGGLSVEVRYALKDVEKALFAEIRERIPGLPELTWNCEQCGRTEDSDVTWYKVGGKQICYCCSINCQRSR